MGLIEIEETASRPPRVLHAVPSISSILDGRDPRKVSRRAPRAGDPSVRNGTFGEDLTDAATFHRIGLI
jgi:hypothetical protein